MPDESFMGYLVRLTESNGYDTPAWILKRCGINSALMYVSCSFVFNEATKLTALAHLTGASLEDLLPLMCPLATGQQILRRIFFGLPVPKHLIRLKYSKVCSECLRISNYHHKIWDLATVTACPLHKCLLLAICPNCSKRISWNRKNVSVCQCLYDWRTAPVVMVSESELVLIRLTYQRLGILGSNNESNLTRKNPLLKLDLGDMLTAVVTIASQYSGNRDVRANRLTTSYKNEEIHTLLIKGFAVFENWPRNYYRFLDWKRTQNKNELRSGLKYDFGSLNGILKHSLSSEKFDFMRRAFEEYLKTKWDGGFLFKRALRLTKNSGSKPRYMSQAEVTRELRMNNEVLSRLVEEGTVKALVRRSKTYKVFLFDRENVQAVKRILEELLTAGQVSRLLGIRLRTVVELVQKGCLKAFDGPTASAHRHSKISTDEVKHLVNAIDSKLVKVSLSSRDNIVAFKKVVFRIISYGLSVSDFVKAILDGEIAPYNKVQGVGLSCYEFVEEHLQDYIERHKQRLTGDTFQIRDVMKALGVSRQSIIHLVRREFLLSEKVKIGNSTITVVSVEAMETFNSTYVLATKIAYSVDTSPKFLIKCLEKNNVQPICGRGAGQKIHYVYRRADLEKLDIEAMISEAKAGKIVRDNLGDDKIISSEEVSDLLGVDIVSLIKLVKRKIVKPYSQVSNPKDGKPYYLFRLSIIEEIRSAVDDCAQLITTSEAAKMLGETDGWFIAKWVHTKRLRAIKFKHVREQHFFLRPEIKALAQFKQNTISSKEAAKILRVARITIYKWTISGKLKLASGPSIDGFGNHLYLRRDIERLRKERDRKTRHIALAA
jgi:hypothetical protein